jgi:transposase-like protein
MTKPDPFCYFKTSREVIRLAVMLYVHFPLSLRNVEALLHERGIEVSHETVDTGGTGLLRCLPRRTENGVFPA